MAIKINEKGVNNAKKLIRQGKVDLESEWEFTTEDENKILEKGGWKEYALWFLAIDDEANEETKARYKFPYGKNGKVYRRAIIAAKQRASQFDYKNIYDVADNLLQMIDERFMESLTIAGRINEAIIDNGQVDRWEVVIISEGESMTSPRFFYTADVLKESVPQFEGVQVFANSQGPHIDPDKKTVRDIVGWIDNVRFENGEVKGILHLLPSAQWLSENLKFAWENKKLDVYELSIDAIGKWAKENGKNVVKSIDRVLSVDVVPKAARGGRFVRILNSESIESKTQIQEEGKMKEVVQELKAKYPQLFEGIDVENVELKDLLLMLIERVNAPINQNNQNNGGQVQMSKNDQEALMNMIEGLKKENEELRKAMEVAKVEQKLKEADIPQKLKEFYLTKFKEGRMTEAEIDDGIKLYRETVSDIKISQPVPFVRFGMDRQDKAKLALEGLFANMSLKPLTNEEIKTQFAGVEPYSSLREAYIDFTGDYGLTGRFREATLADWNAALGNAMNRMLVRDYGEMALDTWKAFVDIVPLNDFRKVSRIRIGGWTNLQTVNENQNYPSLSGGNQDAVIEYLGLKKGGLISVTWEMIRNDDIGAIKQAIRDLARAAAQTLHEFIYDLVNPAINGVIYDSVALYHSTHNNLLTDALSNNSLSNARKKLKKQTRPGANKPLGTRARYLLIPSDLEETAYEILTASYGQYNETPSFLQAQGIQAITVDYWADANNWVLVGDKRDIVGIEIGFLDGKEEPELLAQDVPAGDWFYKDALTYKVRFVFGGAVVDYRAFVGAIVP
jgi:hypothetical protein